jgi:hypothetical protein
VGFSPLLCRFESATLKHGQLVRRLPDEIKPSGLLASGAH